MVTDEVRFFGTPIHLIFFNYIMTTRKKIRVYFGFCCHKSAGRNSVQSSVSIHFLFDSHEYFDTNIMFTCGFGVGTNLIGNFIFSVVSKFD